MEENKPVVGRRAKGLMLCNAGKENGWIDCWPRSDDRKRLCGIATCRDRSTRRVRCLAHAARHLTFSLRRRRAAVVRHRFRRCCEALGKGLENKTRQNHEGDAKLGSG